MARDEEQVKRRFGELVRARRKKRDLTQEVLGEMSGLHRTYVSSLERGERNVSLYNIVRLADALGVTPSELFDGF